MKAGLLSDRKPVIMVSMVLESLILGLCIGGWECSTATQAYYAQNKDLQERVKYYERYGKRVIGPNGEAVVAVLAPMIALGSGQEASFRVSNHLSLKVGLQKKECFLVLSF